MQPTSQVIYVGTSTSPHYIVQTTPQVIACTTSYPTYNIIPTQSCIPSKNQNNVCLNPYQKPVNTKAEITNQSSNNKAINDTKNKKEKEPDACCCACIAALCLGLCAVAAMTKNNQA